MKEQFYVVFNKNFFLPEQEDSKFLMKLVRNWNFYKKQYEKGS